ncbi:MAG: hypothetical protein HY291_22365 [Planctomycetes bacterium]|nr:hypothetical protein [Planctomycetota bacterium]
MKKKQARPDLDLNTLSVRQIQLLDHKDNLRAFLFADAEADTVHFNLCDAKGTPRISISLDPKGEPHIVFYGLNRSPALAIGATNEGEAGLSIYNINQPKSSLRIGVAKPTPANRRKTKSAEPIIEMRNSDGGGRTIEPDGKP